ncbi:extracellular solute-binding protein [Paracoccus sediminicola]|uniref:extracellular solute-binding protein n=1 Tax=Paracoccus sediminicola TaxID=3017783 RepID=UPI0022F11CA3|nr:extracellular solute-binding protein [Paracoccus sediminicola]WBU56250.1 extracellular solute-binding protein [Paracoccus sediminicola]
MTYRIIAAAALAGSTVIAGSAGAVEIEYWQYVYDTRVEAMDQLIAKFQEANPDITVKQVTFPYADYQTRIVAANMAGQAPDVMQLFYGWADQFIAGGLIQPLPEDAFPPAEIEAEFFPIVSAMQRDGQYYGLPTAVRSLALFYNKALLQEAGVEPPTTLEDLVAVAKATAKADAGGNLETVGITMDPAGQDHHWWREVLDRQMGGAPYNEDYTQVTYADEAGAEALGYYIGLARDENVTQLGFMDEGQAAFKAGRAAMTIDGTFRLGSFSEITDFEWAVTELPANAEGERSNYASYFANAIGAKTEGEELEASIKFLQYVSSPEAMEIWLEVVGELPARRSAALTDENLANETYAPFLKGLEYAHTTRFVDEAAQRQVAIDMVNRVMLEDQAIPDALAQAAEEEQKIIDDAAD